MNPAASSEAVSQQELLHEAIARQSPIALSCRVSDGWAGFYSKFLQESQNPRGVLLEYPWSDGAYVPELVAAQTFGISFRRGPKRCVFSSNLIATRRIDLGGTEIPAVLIEWPEQIFELQRRLDYRAPVPADASIEVTARRQSSGEKPSEAASHGRLVDISAGGMSIVFPTDGYPQWEYGDVIESTFVAAPQHQPFDLIGRVRYAQHTRSAFRIGIQWYGLEATESGRETLDRIIDLCSDYQAQEMKRLGLARPAGGSDDLPS